MPGHTRTTRSDDSESTSTDTTTSSSASGIEEHDTLGNSAIADIIRNHNKYAGEQKLDPGLTGIIHIGMNEGAHAEASALNAANRGHGGAKSIRDQKEQDTLVRGGKKYKFDSEEDCALFAASLGVRPEQALKLAELIAGGSQYAKDELAQIGETYAQADLGKRDMSRVVFSGHSVGDSIWGDNNGEIPFDTFASLRTIFPKAANQVKHLAISACYAGGERNLQQFFQAFPSLESIWAYHDSSPGTFSGAIDHLKAWENATDENGSASAVDPELAKGMRKAGNVATWNRVDGYQGAEAMDILDIESLLREQDDLFVQYFKGEVEVENTQTGPLRNYYNLVQRYLAHPEASRRVAEMEKRRDITIRLIYWKTVVGKFGEAYKSALREGHAAVSMTEPDWGKVTRGGAMAHIEAFDAAASGNDKAEEAKKLLQGLKEMDPAVILTSWV